jgi:predicted MPP superfamily phosphohydrolase
MKLTPFLIFFSVVLVFYSLINYYIFSKGLQFFNAYPRIYTLVFWLIVAAYPLGRIMERLSPSLFSTVLIWIGAFWLAFMVYFFLFSVLTDLSSLIMRIFHLPQPTASVKQILFFVVISISSLAIILGHLNARFPKVKHLELQLPVTKAVKMVMVSDIHLGTLVGNNRIRYIVNKINALKPDIVVFAGDVIDEDVGPVIRQNLGDALIELKAPLGIYAVTGNHEYIGGAKAAVDYLQNHGIKVLRDSAVLIDDNFYLIGREDRESKRFSNVVRKPLLDLTNSLLPNKARILLDHQPFELNKAVEAGIDLSLSGHTHHGQLWPFNFITRAVFENSYGYLSKSGTQFYVSCGAGTWGPPVRTSSRAEIVMLNLLPK